MIDSSTGEIRFDDGTVIVPSLTRASFVASVQAVGAWSDSEAQMPWSFFRPTPRLMDGAYFGSSLMFRGDILQSVNLWRSDPYPTEKSWDEWSMDKEVADQKWNEAWLACLLGPHPNGWRK